jgi:hypothetical protein
MHCKLANKTKETYLESLSLEEVSYDFCKS